MNGACRLAASSLLAALVAGCAATPVPPPAAAGLPPPVPAAPVVAAAVVPAPSPVAPAESPPFEPVAVAAPAPAAAPTPAPSGSSPPREAERLPAPTATPAPAAGVEPPAAAPPAAVSAPSAAAEPSDEQLMAAVVADLQRYAQYAPDEVRRELAVVAQTLNRQRNDANRVRLAVLYTLVRTPQDDQRALQLFDSVAKSGPGSPAIKQLAVVLQVQVAERARAVREEQQKADAAVQKLEALRAMERSLLRDRVRSGGGGGGGGGGSGN